MLFFLGLHGLTKTAQGEIALVGDNVRGTSLAPPLEDKSGFGPTCSPAPRAPARRNVDPGSRTTELGCEGVKGFPDRIPLTVSIERLARSEASDSADAGPAREAGLMAMGCEAFSVEAWRVLANRSAIAPFWFFSTVSMAGFTLP